MNLYVVVLRGSDGNSRPAGTVEARSLELAARAMRAALKANRDATRCELWLDARRVSVIVRRRKRLVMTDDQPRFVSNAV